ncbi:MAG: hypothetical protein FWD73_12830 [Polyangiaceae bacterium]|nr:hypothetical protein [Polyangiaceae bacterium]
MSMKRTKPRSSGKSQDTDDGGFWLTPSEPEKSWEEQVANKADSEFVAYALTTRLEKGQLVTHSKFGKGIVVHADASKVEILFQDGKKKLGHGQPG